MVKHGYYITITFPRVLLNSLDYHYDYPYDNNYSVFNAKWEQPVRYSMFLFGMSLCLLLFYNRPTRA